LIYTLLTLSDRMNQVMVNFARQLLKNGIVLCLLNVFVGTTKLEEKQRLKSVAILRETFNFLSKSTKNNNRNSVGESKDDSIVDDHEGLSEQTLSSVVDSNMMITHVGKLISFDILNCLMSKQPEHKVIEYLETDQESPTFIWNQEQLKTLKELLRKEASLFFHPSDASENSTFSFFGTSSPQWSIKGNLPLVGSDVNENSTNLSNIVVGGVYLRIYNEDKRYQQFQLFKDEKLARNFMDECIHLMLEKPASLQLHFAALFALTKFLFLSGTFKTNSSNISSNSNSNSKQQEGSQHEIKRKLSAVIGTSSNLGTLIQLSPLSEESILSEVVGQLFGFIEQSRGKDFLSKSFELLILLCFSNRHVAQRILDDESLLQKLFAKLSNLTKTATEHYNTNLDQTTTVSGATNTDGETILDDTAESNNDINSVSYVPPVVEQFLCVVVSLLLQQPLRSMIASEILKHGYASVILDDVLPWMEIWQSKTGGSQHDAHVKIGACIVSVIHGLEQKAKESLGDEASQRFLEQLKNVALLGNEEVSSMASSFNVGDIVRVDLRYPIARTLKSGLSTN